MAGKTPLREAVDRLGGSQKVAALMGVSDTAVNKWLRADRVPLARLAKFSILAERPAGDFNKDVARLSALGRF